MFSKFDSRRAAIIFEAKFGVLGIGALWVLVFRPGVDLCRPQADCMYGEAVQGIPLGVPRGHAAGYPRGYPEGYPAGYLGGKPRGIPQGIPGDSSGDLLGAPSEVRGSPGVSPTGSPRGLQVLRDGVAVSWLVLRIG